MSDENVIGLADGAHNVPFVTDMAPGVNGEPFTVIQREPLVPQPLVAVTQTAPDENGAPGMVELTLFPPAVMLAGVDPLGNVQLNVAPVCGGQPNDANCAHNPLVFGAVIDDGTVGNPMVIVFDLNAVVTPQLFV